LQRKGKAAIVDAPFNTEEDRTLAAEKAKEASAQPTFIETVTMDPAVSRRMMVMNVQDAPWYGLIFCFVRDSLLTRKVQRNAARGRTAGLEQARRGCKAGVQVGQLFSVLLGPTIRYG